MTAQPATLCGPRPTTSGQFDVVPGCNFPVSSFASPHRMLAALAVDPTDVCWICGFQLPPSPQLGRGGRHTVHLRKLWALHSVNSAWRRRATRRHYAPEYLPPALALCPNILLASSTGKRALFDGLYGRGGGRARAPGKSGFSRCRLIMIFHRGAASPPRITGGAYSVGALQTPLPLARVVGRPNLLPGLTSCA